MSLKLDLESKTAEIEQKKLGLEDKSLRPIENIENKNSHAKEEMARELAAIGLSHEAIERVLHLDKEAHKKREKE